MSIARVESEVDPRNPARTAYRITADTMALVQDAISDLMATVDTAFGGAPGHAQFTHPVRLDHGYGALGSVVTFEREVAHA